MPNKKEQCEVCGNNQAQVVSYGTYHQIKLMMQYVGKHICQDCYYKLLDKEYDETNTQSIK